MYLDDDTFWHFGVGITIYKESETLAQETVLIPFLIKKENNSYIVKLGKDGKEFRVNKDNADDLKKIYDHIFEHIKEFYEKGLKRFLVQNSTVRRMGFNT